MVDHAVSGDGEGARVPRRVWYSTALLTAGRVVGALAGLAALALLSRSLSGDEFGRFTFYLAAFFLLDVLADFGTSTAVIQLGAHDDSALVGAIRAGRSIRRTAAAVGFVAVSTLAFALGEDGAPWVAIAALLPITRSLELSSVVYHSRIAWRVPVAVRSVAALIRLAAMLVLWGLGVDTFGPYLLAHAASGALANLVLHGFARAQLAAIRSGAASIGRHALFVASIPLAAAALAQQAYFYADNLVVRSLCGELELGRYNAAVRILSFLVLVAGLATNAALPWLTRRAKQGELARATVRLSLPLFLVACVVVVVLWPLADEILTLCFGAGFESAAPSLRWLLVAVAIIYAGSGLLTAVVASGRSASLLAIVIGGLAFNVAANLYLVPDFGIEGAALATVGTELFVALASLAVLATPVSRPR